MRKYQKKNVALFDFDKTIVSCDTAYNFIKFLIFESFIRVLLAVLLMPIGFTLFNLKCSKNIGVSLFLWIGTFGLKDEEFNKVLVKFTKMIKDKPVDAIIFKDALNIINKCQASGCEILIISASPQVLVERLLPEIITNHKGINVLGSELKRLIGGLVYSNYCYNENKVKIAIKNGFGQYYWKSGYSDNISDIPLLERCQYRYLVNPNKKILKRVSILFGKNYSILYWK